MYTVCLHDYAKEEVQTLSVDEMNRVEKRLHRLRNGLWKNGTRVKRLQAVNKKLNIFEARIDKGNRMLFSIYYDSDLLETIILVFRLSLHHDDVIRIARTIVDDDLDYELYQTEEIETTESFEQFANHHKELWKNDYYFHQFQQLKAYEIDEETLTRFMMKQDEDLEEFWEMKLRLTSEQRSLLKMDLPLLISGTAGSGKTTILIHKLLEGPAVSKLYITYSKQLRDEAEKQFLSLVKGLDEEEEYKRQTTFLTFKDFLKRHMEERFQTIVTKDHFIQYYQKLSKGQHLEKEFPALMLWEEFRGVIKGGLFQSSHTFLSENEYVALSSNEAPNFYKNRKKVYRIFLSYQEYLAKHYLIDEQDLLQKLLKLDLPSFEMVLCDEIQDLTMHHIKLLFKLANNKPNRLMFAGDDHQVVHHSGFRWENVKNAFYHTFKIGISDVHSLSKNFRNTGNIASFAREINQLQKDYTDFKYKSDQTVPFQYGEMPKLLKDIEDHALFPTFNHFGPYDAILIRDEESKEQLTKDLAQSSKQPLLFTIYEAKGLEFRKVLLWKILHDESSEAKQWKKIVNRINKNELFQDDLVMQRFIRYEASLLYVAVTRGMKECWIYDGPTSADIWNMEHIQKQLEIQTSVNLQKEDIDYSDADWKERGDLFFKRGLYDQAKNCYLHVSADEEVKNRILVCRAYIEKQHANYEEAGNLFRNAQLYDEAIECFEVAEQYAAIFKICKRADPAEKNPKWISLKNEYKIKEFDSNKQWVGSGIYCKRQRYYKEALLRFEIDGDDQTDSINDVYHLAINDTNLPLEELKKIGHFFKTSAKYRDEQKVNNIQTRLDFLRDLAYIKDMLQLIQPDYNDYGENLIVETFKVNNQLKNLTPHFSFEDPHVQYIFALMAENLGMSEGTIRVMLKRAADKNHPQAQFTLGAMLEDINQMEEAVYYYKKAANQQHPFATFNLANYYLSVNNAKEGMYWMNHALELKFEDAYSELAYHLFKGDVIPKDEKRAELLQREYKKVVQERKKQETLLKNQVETRKKEIDRMYSINVQSAPKNNFQISFF
ncbi:AAA domain-containing protein [Ureibacillus xyleni]|uniref:AAA domain-containing protein n=1 Tax=Ureibacillus xyleni TaxID=614648 RepID=A0A285TP97_9BACL|nr:UvrD-helicase domain-containing protein [Ureibacillus xyleni]SOC22754.1 AAA domain-containing protein [Ureibacillus xyleni]